MLRSVAVWFPHFLRFCQSRLNYVMNPLEMDYQPMKQVTRCETYRQVRSVLKAYYQPHFDDLVHAQKLLPKKAITRDAGIRFKYTVFFPKKKQKQQQQERAWIVTVFFVGAIKF